MAMKIFDFVLFAVTSTVESSDAIFIVLLKDIGYWLIIRYVVSVIDGCFEFKWLSMLSVKYEVNWEHTIGPACTVFNFSYDYCIRLCITTCICS